MKNALFFGMISTLSFLSLNLLGTPIYAEEPLAEETAPIAFSDVEPEDQHYVAISYLHDIGIIDGYEDNTFKPYNKINRAEALKMLTIASGLFTNEPPEAENENIEPPFTDTPHDAWYIPYLVTAKEKGVISGYSDNTFKPDQTINLAESLRIYLESFENLEYPPMESNLFADTPAEYWFTKYTSYASSKNMLEINWKNEIFPDQEMTRGYMAEIIYRKIRADEGFQFGKATFYGAAVQGSGTASGDTFDMNSYTTAHRTLPFGSIVEVKNLDNGKTVQVKVTDRGPYGPGRVLDLSTAAFEQIASLGTGVIDVEFKALFIPEE